MLLGAVGACAGESSLEQAHVGHLIDVELLPAVRRPAPACAAQLIPEHRFDATTDAVVVGFDDAGPSGFVDERDETLLDDRAHELGIHGSSLARSPWRRRRKVRDSVNWRSHSS